MQVLGKTDQKNRLVSPSLELASPSGKSWIPPVELLQNQILIFLPPANEVWGKIIFLHLSVILLTWGGEYLGRYTLRQGTPPGQVHPQAGTPPREQGSSAWLGDTGNKRAVRILLECILVLFVTKLELNKNKEFYDSLHSLDLLLQKNNIYGILSKYTEHMVRLYCPIPIPK